MLQAESILGAEKDRKSRRVLGRSGVSLRGKIAVGVKWGRTIGTVGFIRFISSALLPQFQLCIFQLLDPIPQFSRFLKIQILGCSQHLLAHLFDQFG